eukprot:1142473-Pelagomonas_calceolata.AAC.7
MPAGQAGASHHKITQAGLAKRGEAQVHHAQHGCMQAAAGCAVMGCEGLAGPSRHKITRVELGREGNLGKFRSMKGLWGRELAEAPSGATYDPCSTFCTPTVRECGVALHHGYSLMCATECLSDTFEDGTSLAVQCAHPQPLHLIGTIVALKCSRRYKLPEHVLRFV